MSVGGFESGAIAWQVPAAANHGLLTFTPQVSFEGDWTWVSPPGTATLEFSMT